MSPFYESETVVTRNRILITLPFLISACAVGHSLSQGAQLVVKPQFSGISTLADASAYSKQSINRLELQLFTVSNGETTPTGISRALSNIQLDNAVVFSQLKAHTTYRIKSLAYALDDTLISSGDADSYTDITIENDDRPTVLPLKVKLIDRVFNAGGTSSIQIIPGGHTYSGALAVSLPTFQGIVETFVGNDATDSADGVGTAATIRYPYGITCDAAGNLYVAASYQIRKITPQGQVTTLAGLGSYGFADGDGTAAKFNTVQSLTVDRDGNLYVADYGNYRIRKVTPTGTVTTIAGNGTNAALDGTGVQAKLMVPSGITLDRDQKHLYVCEYTGGRIRKIHLDNQNYVETIAGNGLNTSVDGIGTAATFNRPGGVVIDDNGMLYISEVTGRRVRRLDTATRQVIGWVGNGTYNPYISASGTSASLTGPRGLAMTPYGYLFIADSGGHRLRQVAPNHDVVTLTGNGIGALVNGPAETAQLFNPMGVAVDASGTIYVADYNNHRIRKIY